MRPSFFFRLGLPERFGLALGAIALIWLTVWLVLA
jgi:hypothetical protein